MLRLPAVCEKGCSGVSSDAKNNGPWGAWAPIVLRPAMFGASSNAKTTGSQGGATSRSCCAGGANLALPRAPAVYRRAPLLVSSAANTLDSPRGATSTHWAKVKVSQRQRTGWRTHHGLAVRAPAVCRCVKAGYVRRQQHRVDYWLAGRRYGSPLCAGGANPASAYRMT